MFCYKCGNQLPDDAEFCNKCGEKLYKRAKKEQTSSFNDDQNGFINFIDSRIKANTQYNSAQELLNSKPAARFAWLSFGISAGIMLILSVIGILNGGGILGVVLLLALSIAPGYLAAYLSGGVVVKIKQLNKYTLKVKGKADTEEVILFLNKYLSYLKPYFETWENKTTKIISRFGADKRLLMQIEITPNFSGDSEYTTCVFNVDSERSGYNFIASYMCIEKTAPILRAALEYYFLLKYGDESDVSATTYSTENSNGFLSYVQKAENTALPQNLYNPIEESCVVEAKKTRLKSVLINVVVWGIIALIVAIVLIFALRENNVNSSTGISNVSLTNTYTNKNENFSFKYPSDWNEISNPAVFVELSSPDGMANIQVIECFFDAYGVFTDSEVEIKNSVNQFHTFLDLWNTKLDDVL